MNCKLAKVEYRMTIKRNNLRLLAFSTLTLAAVFLSGCISDNEAISNAKKAEAIRDFEFGTKYGWTSVDIAPEDKTLLGGSEASDASVKFSQFQQSCDEGSQIGCFSLGLMYYVGKGTSKNVEQAKDLFQRSCDSGEPKSCHSLGVIYSNGKDAVKDYHRAWLNFRKACAVGIVASCGSVSVAAQLAKQHSAKTSSLAPVKTAPGKEVFNKGFEAHTAQQYDKAIQAYRQSAELGYPKGYRYVGILYRAGYGVEKNLHEAFVWIERAAVLGDADAQYDTASSYMFGKGVQKDKKKADYWYRQSAKNGNTLSIDIVKRLDGKKSFEIAAIEYSKSVSGSERTKFEALEEVFCAGFAVPQGDPVEAKCSEFAAGCMKVAGAKEDFQKAYQCVAKPILFRRSLANYRDRRTPAQKERENKSISQLLIAYGHSGNIEEYVKSK